LFLSSARLIMTFPIQDLSSESGVQTNIMQVGLQCALWEAIESFVLDLRCHSHRIFKTSVEPYRAYSSSLCIACEPERDFAKAIFFDNGSALFNSVLLLTSGHTAPKRAFLPPSHILLWRHQCVTFPMARTSPSLQSLEDFHSR